MNQFDEFESEDQVEKDQENESVYENETILQPICEPIINPNFEKCIIHESPKDQFFDIFDDDDCIYLDDLFEENIEMHTISLEDADNNCDDACLDEKFLLHEKEHEDESDYFCEKTIVEEHQFSSKDVEKIMRTPFKRKPLDLSIFTFDDQLNDNFF